MVSLRICLATFTMVYMTSAFQPLLRCAPPGLSALASSATTAGSWQDYQARIKNCVVAIGDRLDESVAVDAPEASFAGATDAFTPIDFDALQQELDDKSSTATSCSSLAAQLAKWHFAVVRLNPTDSVAVSGLWEHAARFYTLPHEDRLDLAGPVRPEASEDASLVVGYCAMEDNAFLETRLAPQYEFRPRFERFSGTARVGPPSQDPDPQALLAGRHVLTRAGLTAVRATERALAAPESCDDGSSASLANEDGGWARLVDDGGRVPLGSLTASVHRVCHYSSGAGKEVAGSATGEGLAAEPRKTVAFGAHTDATFFTVVPVAEVPGLQVFTPEAGWVSPEEHSAHGTDVVLMTGEFLEVLTGGALPCAVHRVLKPRPGHRSRLSAPLLLRGREKESLVPAPKAATGGLLDSSSGLLGSRPSPVDNDAQSRSRLPTFPPGVTVTDMHRLLLTLFSEDTRRRETN